MFYFVSASLSQLWSWWSESDHREGGQDSLHADDDDGTCHGLGPVRVSLQRGQRGQCHSTRHKK